MVKTLENFVNSTKEVGKDIRKHWKETITAIALPFVFTNNVEAGRLRVYNRSNDVTFSSAYIDYIDGATEGKDGNHDSYYLSDNPNILHIYSVNNLCDPNKLQVDARGINSTTTYNLELYNKEFVETADNFFRFRMYDSNNFEWKNLFLGDKNDSNDIIADIKYVISSDGRTYEDGTPYGDFYIDDVNDTPTGVYDKRKIMPFNHADLNRDRKVNGLDYAVFANEFGKDNISDPNRFGSYVGKDVNDLGAYADINRDGFVDPCDLGDFSYEWLWDADDPNTW